MRWTQSKTQQGLLSILYDDIISIISVSCYILVGEDIRVCIFISVLQYYIVPVRCKFLTWILMGIRKFGSSKQKTDVYLNKSELAG